MRPLLLLALVAAVLGAGAVAADAASKAKPSYYLSLGDSLATGYHKTRAGTVAFTRRDYTHLLYRRAAKRVSNLRLAVLGCSGEDTTTFRTGPCPQPRRAAERTPQLTRAVRFLRAHRGHVRYVTLAIGADGLARCATGGIDLACVAAEERRLEQDLPRIDRALRRAGGRHVRIAQLLLYNPYLQYYLRGADYQSLALASDAPARRINRDIRAAGRPHGLAFADGYTAFDAGNLSTTTPFGGKTVPTAVARVCHYTQMCAKPPQSDMHPSAAGYAALYGAFKKALKLE
jgi:lysophospholipase L1-like esterase